jgi:hypothetical protein
MSAARTLLDKATEYRRLALAASALVETSVLANVREKHELAAARWSDLAVLAERSSAERLSRISVGSRGPAPELAPPFVDALILGGT